MRPVREGVQTPFAGTARPVGGDGEERKPVTGIGGSAGDLGQVVHGRG
jgi:hypothetical protein